MANTMLPTAPVARGASRFGKLLANSKLYGHTHLCRSSLSHRVPHSRPVPSSPAVFLSNSVPSAARSSSSSVGCVRRPAQAVWPGRRARSPDGRQRLEGSQRRPLERHVREAAQLHRTQRRPPVRLRAAEATRQLSLTAPREDLLSDFTRFMQLKPRGSSAAPHPEKTSSRTSLASCS